MPDWTQDRLLLFLLFFVPGFVSIKVYDLLVPSERRDFQSTLGEAIGYSAVNFAVLLPLVAAVDDYGWIENPWIRVAAAYIILLAAPVVWPWLLVAVIQPRFATLLVSPVRRPWDAVFRARREAWIIVHLSDGRRIGGRFGRDSRASSYPAENQLYLEEVWRLDEEGAFVAPVAQTRGILLSGRDIRAVEFFE